ncbi:ABC transporter ATP-binding protein, partial [Rhizobium ruizarguesonis]
MAVSAIETQEKPRVVLSARGLRRDFGGFTADQRMHACVMHIEIDVLD